MSPQRVVTLKRWQVLAAFAAVTAAFVVATVIATNASNSAHATAAQARQLALENRAAAERADRVRAELVRKIHQQDVVNCRRVRVGNHVLRDAILRGIRMSRAQLDGPVAKTPDARALLLRNIRESRRFLVKLARADCLGVPPLAPPPPIKTAP